MFANRHKYHRYIYIFALSMLGVMLPWSEYLMSVSQFLLLFNWLTEGGFKKKFQILKERKSILAFISIIFIHFLWMFNTSDIDYALHDIQIKIPIFVLALIIGTTRLISKKELQIILTTFVIATFTASLFAMVVYFGYTKFEYTGYRDMSVFISHIRFSLMVVMAIATSVYLLINERILVKSTFIIIAIWLSIFLGFLNSFTGIIIFFILLSLSVIILIYRFKPSIVKYGLFTLVIITILLSLFWLNNSINKFYTHNNINNSTLAVYTQSNNTYMHDTVNTFWENGNLIYVNICDKELKKSWNKTSELNFDSTDNRNNILRYTLYRYMSSKSLKKDSVGFTLLSNTDIKNIENGMPNYLFENKFSPYVFLYKFLWEYEINKTNNDINNKSFMQRFEFFQAGKNIFLDNFCIGVGTGDLQLEFDNYYTNTNSKLNNDNRFRAHNQFLSFLIAFGIIGFILIIFAFIYPIYVEKNKIGLLLIAFLLIVFLSFLNEDTLETQPGVTFFTFFYVLLIFGYKTNSKTKVVR